MKLDIKNKHQMQSLLRLTIRLQNSRVFFLKSVRKSVKRGARVLRQALPISILRVRSDQGVQKCRQAVKNLFTTPPLCEFDTLPD